MSVQKETFSAVIICCDAGPIAIRPNWNIIVGIMTRSKRMPVISRSKPSDIDHRLNICFATMHISPDYRILPPTPLVHASYTSSKLNRPPRCSRTHLNSETALPVQWVPAITQCCLNWAITYYPIPLAMHIFSNVIKSAISVGIFMPPRV